MEKMRRK